MESIPAYLYSDEEVFEHIRVIAKYKDILNNNKLISKNEELEDISTDILGYLMIDYIVAQLYGKLMMNRVVMNCITGKEMTGEEQRNERIEKYRMKKELKEGIEKFQKLREDERDDLMKKLKEIIDFFIQTFKQTMLTQIQQLKDDGIYEQTKQNEEIEAQKYRKQLQPFTITKGMTPEKLELLQNVFNPRFKYVLEKPAEDPHSSDEDSDQEKRYWDNFKDLHPKGSGNTLNMG
ncbi:Uncharacterized protein QTN25_000370 [Entamoeba marina]